MTTKTQTGTESRRRQACGKYGAIAAWAIVVCAGWYWIERQAFTENRPPATLAVDHWPTDSAIERPAGRPALVLFVHPRCPCTQATLAELERLETSLPDDTRRGFDTVIISTVPADAGADWLETDSIARARKLSNATVHIDRDGQEAARFGAHTSGMVMVFDANGDRRYAGGVTNSRGHEGDNVGRRTVGKVLRGEPTTIRDLPAFGCLLCLPGDRAEQRITQVSTSPASEPAQRTRTRSSDTTRLAR